MSASAEQKRRKIWQQTRLNLSIVGDLSHSDNIFSVFNEKREKFALNSTSTKRAVCHVMALML
jgi:hypothetical protein